MVVRHELCRCGLEEENSKILFLTVGVETEEGEIARFQPVASFAFERSLGNGDTGQWLGMWVYGPTSANFFRHFVAWLPIPAKSPGTSEKKVARLEALADRLAAGDDNARGKTPAPYLTLAQVGKIPKTVGVGGMLQSGFRWANVYNPAQMLYRTYHGRRSDRGARNFQRAHVALSWLLDAEFDSEQDRGWVKSLYDIQFHMLRSRSLFGRFVTEAEAVDLVLGYGSTMRERMGKSSAWMQSAANEHYLRYEPIYRQARNSRSLPVGGVLYYDPSLPAGDPDWWGTANPFDLRHNPHTDPEVQRVSRENPGELIPLAIYTYQTSLKMRPIIAVDFFNPTNPRKRENNQQIMSLLGNWLAIATGGFSLERIPYRVVTYAANKKGYTWFVNQPSSQGIEEMRMALESGLYFDSSLQPLLRHRLDKRVFNPLVKSGPEERARARVQYESLRANRFADLSKQVKSIREKMMKRLSVPPGLPPEERTREFARQLEAWRQLRKLRTLAERAAGDYGSLTELQEPLNYFESMEAPLPPKLPETLEHTYAELLLAERFLADNNGPAELTALRQQTFSVWEKVARLDPSSHFDQRRSMVDMEVEKRFAKAQKKAREKQAKQLKKLLKKSGKELQRAAGFGCDPRRYSQADLEAFLIQLRDVALVAQSSESLRRELDKQRAPLEQALHDVETTLASCRQTTDVQVAESQATGAEMTRAVLEALAPRDVAAAGGGN